jgi:phosphohistidine phosphatase SixA
MQELIILRHARAVPWHPGVEDFPRALSEAGREHAATLARWICDHAALPDEILCSPSQRTRETLAPLLAMRPDLECRTSFVPQIYGASTGTLTQLLDGAFAGSDRVLMVGHNPGFEMLAFDLLAPSERGRLEGLPTGTLLVIGFRFGWPGDAGRGTLRHIVRGRQR